MYIRHVRSAGKEITLGDSFPPPFTQGLILGLGEMFQKETLTKALLQASLFPQVPVLDHPVQRPFARLQIIVSGSPDAFESCREKCIYVPLNDHPLFSGSWDI